jgi:hypothetical protein
MKAHILRDMPDQLWRQIRALSNVDNCTIDTVIQAALEAYVAERYRAKETEDRTAQA